jgi:hypothetical protein
MIVLCTAALIAVPVWFNAVWPFFAQRARNRIVVPVTEPKGRSL